MTAIVGISPTLCIEQVSRCRRNNNDEYNKRAVHECNWAKSQVGNMCGPVAVNWNSVISHLHSNYIFVNLSTD